MNWRSACVVLASLLAVESRAQEGLPEPRGFESVPPVVSFFAPLIFPKILQDDYLLREYIRSEGFAHYRATRGDLAGVDAIFQKAVRLSWGNIYEALLISLLGTMDHRRVGVRVPLLGLIVWLPLTSEFQEDFDARLKALPSRMYADSPREGDRDKLQHFFGSAFLTFLFESAEGAQSVGDFVEWGEDSFIEGGEYDQRDARANVQGQRFGLRLLVDVVILPSDVLRSTQAMDTDSVRTEVR